MVMIMSDEKVKQNKVVIGVIGILMYLLLSSLAKLPLQLFNIDYDNMSLGMKQMYLIGYNFFIMFMFFLLYKEDLINSFKDFRKNYKLYFKKYIKVWLIALVVMYISNMAIAILKYKLTGSIGVASNEETIRETLTLAPFYTFISASIYAPFVEELTFRKSFRNIFSKDWAFILISALVFGGLHVFNSGMSYFDLLYLIPYCAPGVAFAYILAKSGNIWNSISLHFLHNTILMILQIILLVKGVL